MQFIIITYYYYIHILYIYACVKCVYCVYTVFINNTIMSNVIIIQYM